MSAGNGFRQQARDWLEANCPPSMREPIRSDDERCWGGRLWQFHSNEQKHWLERMASRGWTAPTWPAQYGGGGLSADEAKILREEMAAINARPPLDSFGIWMIGPALLRYGNEAQKQQHLPAIVSGQIRWCQGYSEPNAGSDLANLQTRAEDCGDHYLINGRKIWTSYADQADWMFCLVRTKSGGRKQEGISLILFDMQTEGISTSPIRLISGRSPFCEVQLDNVRADKDQLVGEENKGWTIAKYLLTHERETIGAFGETAPGERTLGEQAVSALPLVKGRIGNSALRHDIARWEMDARSFELTCERLQDESANAEIGHRSAFLKYYGTELNQRRQELLLTMGGADAVRWKTDGDFSGQARQWLRSKGNSIEGGTTEIQLNIIARHILGLS